MAFPATRMRRLRRTEALRDMVRETTLRPADLIQPLFVRAGEGAGRARRRRCPASSGSRSRGLVEEAGAVHAAGVPAVILFGIPAAKDEAGSGAYDDEGIVQMAIRALKEAHPDLVVIADTCLCEYTSHGHCGVLRDGDVDNDLSLELIARTARLPGAARGRRRRPERHDGRARRRDPRRARRARA